MYIAVSVFELRSQRTVAQTTTQGSVNCGLFSPRQTNATTVNTTKDIAATTT